MERCVPLCWLDEFFVREFTNQLTLFALPKNTLTQTLINVVIEQLECMKGTSKANYDYVVLQATDNSIPFYESMGFVRVGAVMLDDADGKPSSRKSADEELEENPFVTSKVMAYKVTTGETLTRIAAKFECDVCDIIFLNKHILGEAQPSSKPKLNIMLLIPAKQALDTGTAFAVPTGEIKWHVAKENETPRTIAKKFNVSCQDIVVGNKGRLPGLISSSRLKDGTRIKVSHFDIPGNEYQAYAHWSFPDSKYEEPEPSYMMVRKLNRRKGNEINNRPIEASLKTPISLYEPTPLLLPASPQPVMPPSAYASLPPKSSAKRTPGQPRPPKRPLSAYVLFASEYRELARGEDDGGKSFGESANVARDLWNELPPSAKAGYEADANAAHERYQDEMAQYKAEVAASYANNPESAHDEIESLPQFPMSAGDPAIKMSLYNKVVRLKPGAMTEGSEFTYWYVLTYIPDLKWCHLAPMIEDGTFGSDKPKALGKPKWKLVDENLGKEVDISSSYCIPIKSRSMRKTLDADKEEWDIIDDGTDPTKMPAITPRALLERRDAFYPSGRRGTTAVKPSVERARKKPFSVAESPSLLASIPGSGVITTVRLIGKNIFDDPSTETTPRRGRPKGSKNKPKSPESLAALAAARVLSVDSKSASDASKKRRTSVVKFDVPASARKAAALRTSTAKKPSGRPPRSLTTMRPHSPASIHKNESVASTPTASASGRQCKVEGDESLSPSEDRRSKRKNSSILAAPSELSDESSDSSFSAVSTNSSSEDLEVEIAESTHRSLRIRKTVEASANNRRHSAAAAVPEGWTGRTRRTIPPCVDARTSGAHEGVIADSAHNSETRAGSRRSSRSTTLLRESPMNVAARPSMTRKRGVPAAEDESPPHSSSTEIKTRPSRKAAPPLLCKAELPPRKRRRIT